MDLFNKVSEVSFQGFMTSFLEQILAIHSLLNLSELGIQVLIGGGETLINVYMGGADGFFNMRVGGLDSFIQFFGSWISRFWRHWVSR